MVEYKTIKEEVQNRLTIKKSEFIGQLYPATTQQQVQDILEKVRKQYWDATHNCWAAVIGPNKEWMRYSDDGEPQGTAGVPMLETLQKSGLTNILAVSTRYFGGVLLGAGGLVRAYTKSIATAIDEAQKVAMRPHLIFTCEFPFKLWGKAQAYLMANGHVMRDIQYGTCVKCEIGVSEPLVEKFRTDMSEMSGGGLDLNEFQREYLEILLK